MSGELPEIVKKLCTDMGVRFGDVVRYSISNAQVRVLDLGGHVWTAAYMPLGEPAEERSGNGPAIKAAAGRAVKMRKGA